MYSEKEFIELHLFKIIQEYQINLWRYKKNLTWKLKSHKWFSPYEFSFWFELSLFSHWALIRTLTLWISVLIVRSQSAHDGYTRASFKYCDKLYNEKLSYHWPTIQLGNAIKIRIEDDSLIFVYLKTFERFWATIIQRYASMTTGECSNALKKYCLIFK